MSNNLNGSKPTGQLCAGHQSALTKALQRKGLWKLCKTDAASVALAAEQWLTGTASQEDFNPVVYCLIEIKGKAEEFGHHPLSHECPLCCVERRNKLQGMAYSWIDNVTDTILLLAKTNRLVP